jgi:LPXTG-site transpeptidase (sortase) family protein
VVVQGTSDAPLQRGPGHYTETPLPGARGNWTTGIAGHRTTYDAPFRHIDKLEPGDRLSLSMPYGRFTYRVEDQRIVDAADTTIFRPVKHDRLALTACHPLYSDAQRIVVYAKLEDERPRVGPGVPGEQPSLARLDGAGKAVSAADVSRHRARVERTAGKRVKLAKGKEGGSRASVALARDGDGAARQSSARRASGSGWPRGPVPPEGRLRSSPPYATAPARTGARPVVGTRDAPNGPPRLRRRRPLVTDRSAPAAATRSRSGRRTCSCS